MKLTIGRAFWIVVGLIVISFVVEDIVPELLAHEVHSPGGSPVSATKYMAAGSVSFRPGPPSESLSDITCLGWVSPQLKAGACSQWIPGLHQTPHTLYYVWPSGCYTKPAPGPDIGYQGFNLEYFDATRTLVIHCYAGIGWIYGSTGVFGIASVTYLLLAISTLGIDAGLIQIFEDDRLEHLIGEQSTEYQLASATIT